jgi:hypothetical protein
MSSDRAANVHCLCPVCDHTRTDITKVTEKDKVSEQYRIRDMSCSQFASAGVALRIGGRK